MAVLYPGLAVLFLLSIEPIITFAVIFHDNGGKNKKSNSEFTKIWLFPRRLSSKHYNSLFKMAPFFVGEIVGSGTVSFRLNYLQHLNRYNFAIYHQNWYFYSNTFFFCNYNAFWNVTTEFAAKCFLWTGLFVPLFCITIFWDSRRIS